MLKNLAWAGGFHLLVLLSLLSLGCHDFRGDGGAAAPSSSPIAAPGSATALQPGYLASLPTQPGTIYNWQIQNGELTSGNGTGTVTFTAGQEGQPLVLTCPVITDSHVTLAEKTLLVQAGPIITAPATVFLRRTGGSVSTAAMPGFNYEWTINSGWTLLGARNPVARFIDWAGGPGGGSGEEPTSAAITLTASNRATGVRQSTTLVIPAQTMDQVPPANLTYPMTTLALQTGEAVPALVPTSDGGSIRTYSVMPDLPQGLALDPETGTIQGVTMAAAEEATYTVLAETPSGRASTTLTIGVRSAVRSSPPGAATCTPLGSVLPSFIGPISGYLDLDPPTMIPIPDAGILISSGSCGRTLCSFDPTSETFSAGPLPNTPSTPYLTSPSAAAVRLDDGRFLFWEEDRLEILGPPGTSAPPHVIRAVPYTIDGLSPDFAWDSDSASASLLKGGQVLWAGGRWGDPSFFAGPQGCYLFDPLSGSLVNVPESMTVGRYNGTATSLPDGSVLFLGGSDSNLNVNPSAERWVPTPKESFSLDNPGTFVAMNGTMSTPRCGHTITPLGDGSTFLVAGGEASVNQESSSGYALPPLLTGGLELLTISADGQTMTSTKVGDLNTPRAFHTATLLEDGRIFFAGGVIAAGDGVSNIATDTTEIFDPKTGAIIPGPHLSLPRAAHSAVQVQGKVLIVGGGPAQDYGGDGNDISPYQTAELFDPGDLTTPPAPAPSVRP